MFSLFFCFCLGFFLSFGFFGLFIYLLYVVFVVEKNPVCVCVCVCVLVVVGFFIYYFTSHIYCYLDPVFVNLARFFNMTLLKVNRLIGALHRISYIAATRGGVIESSDQYIPSSVYCMLCWCLYLIMVQTRYHGHTLTI